MNKKTVITEKYITKPFFNYWEKYEEECYIPLEVLMAEAELVKRATIEEITL